MNLSDQNVSFVPFNAINEFMRPDFRQEVVHSTLQALPDLPVPHQTEVNRLLKRLLQVPGFRNSLAAPISLKLKPSITAFEKNPAFVAVMLSAWSASKPELRQKVNDLLTERGWDLLPPEADRTQMPGFLPTWPANEDFTILSQAFSEKYPADPTSADNVSLMVVWLSGRLPWEKEEDTITPENSTDSD